MGHSNQRPYHGNSLSIGKCNEAAIDRIDDGGGIGPGWLVAPRARNGGQPARQPLRVELGTRRGSVRDARCDVRIDSDPARLVGALSPVLSPPILGAAPERSALSTLRCAQRFAKTPF